MPPRKSQLAPPKRRGQNDENTPIATEDTTQMMDTRAPSPTGSAPWGSPSPPSPPPPPPSPPPPPPSPVQSMAPHLYSTRSYKPDGIYQRLPDRLFSKAAFAGHVDAFKGVEPNFEDTGRISLSKNGAPLRIILFGEMATVADGTRMTARGDRYPYDAPISFKFKEKPVKQRFVLREPSKATPAVKAAWNQQGQNLFNLMSSIEAAYASDPKRPLIGSVRGFYKPVHGNVGATGAGQAALLTLATDSPMYRRPDPYGQVEIPGKQRKLFDRDHLPENEAVPGTMWDANVLEDHQGEQFENHKGARIPQRDHRNKSNKPIYPWDENNDMRPGTLMMWVGSPMAWVMKSKIDPDGERDHVFQILVSSGRVLEESPDDPEPMNAIEFLELGSLAGQIRKLADFEDFDEKDEGSVKKSKA